MSQNGLVAHQESAPAGDRATAFATYVEPEIPLLLRVARTLTASSADAEDLVQDTLLRAYRAVDRFDGAHPRAWLLTILRNTSANLHRRRLPDLVEHWDAVPDPRPAFGANRPLAADDVVVSGILEADLETAVDSLDPRFRAVLLLVDVHGLSYSECAVTLDIPIGTVMSRLSRARGRVRKNLQEAGRFA